MKRVLALLLCLGCHRAEPTPDEPRVAVECVTVTPGPWRDRIGVHGIVDSPPDRHAVVAAQVAGRITAVLVREGDHVTAGAALADVEHGPLDDAARQSEAQVAQATIALQNAETARDRAAHLVETGVGARQALDDANARYETARAAVSAASAAATASRRSVGRSTVGAPLGGVVLRVLRRTGELVDGTPATPIVEIADPGALELAAVVGATEIARIARGQVVEAQLAGLTVKGTVRAVAPAVDPLTGLGTVRIALEPSPVPLGVTGVASIETGARADVMSLPLAAVRTGPDGKPEALECAGDRIHALALKTGGRTRERVEITEGVKPGSRIVADAVLGLQDGSRIAP